MKKPYKIRLGKHGCLFRKLTRIGSGSFQQLGRTTGHLCHKQIPKMREKIPAEISKIMPPHYEFINNCQCLSRVLLCNGLNNAGKHLEPGKAQRNFNITLLNFIAGKADYLIEGALRVTHRS